MDNKIGRAASRVSAETRRALAKTSILRVADQVYERRTALDLSQDDLSERSGLGQKAISEIERGVCVCSIDTLDKLALGLRCKPWELIEP